VTRFKICGLTREEDVRAAVEAGAYAVGFVLEPSSPRCLTPIEAARLAALAEPYCVSVAVYGRASQFVESIGAAQAIEFPGPVPPRSIIAVRPRSTTTLEDVVAAAPACGAILLDAYSEHGFGGMGARVDWALAAEVVRASARPVILAGGLSPENVGEAIRRVRPYAVDVSSGVEVSPGIKDPALILEFAKAVREADANL
jgi:phosphoribosylanthranilate isomerase